MTHEDLVEWGEFAVALAGAAAVLAGLVFVAVSINIDRILAVRGLSGRAGESVVLFMAVLVECAFVLVPHQSIRALGIELLVTGFVAWIIMLMLAVPAVRAPNRQPASWHATRVIVIQLATIPVMLAGTSLLGWPGGELYWLVAGVLIALVAGTANAWVLLVEVVRDQRYQPLTEKEADPGP